MVVNRQMIVDINRATGWGARLICQHFQHMNWSVASVQRVLSRMRNTGTIAMLPRGHRRRTVRTAANIECVRQLSLSPISGERHGLSAGMIARRTGISKRTVRRILKVDLGNKVIIYHVIITSN